MLFEGSVEEVALALVSRLADMVCREKKKRKTQRVI